MTPPSWLVRRRTRPPSLSSLAFPGLLLSVLAVAIIGTGFLAPVTALTLAYTPYIARVTRTLAVRERSLAYVEALRSDGLGGWAICLRHLVPAVWPVIRAQAPIAFGSALVDLAAVPYLGLGVQPPSAEWGLMVTQGRSAHHGSPSPPAPSSSSSSTPSANGRPTRTQPKTGVPGVSPGDEAGR